MYYNNIHGHFNFEFLYDEVVNLYPSGSTFVEVGTYLGKSLCYLAEKIVASGKDIKLLAVDNWVGDPNDILLSKEIEKFGDIYQIFVNNMSKAGVMNMIGVFRSDSAAAASKFNDSSFEFVFIDAAHDYESVKKDILAWLPKVKKGGIIAGHDFGNPGSGVQIAVGEIFGTTRVVDNTWIHYIS